MKIGESGLAVQQLFWIALFFAAYSNVALAQVMGSISGSIEDTSGAVIPAASVTVKNLETGATRTVTTDERGFYRALSLPVGLYEVAAEKTGFKKQVKTGVHLVVGQEAVVNLNMEVGEVQQAVTVTADAPMVNTTTASTSGLVGEREIKDLPLNGRSFDNLILLNPGTGGAASALKAQNASLSPGARFNIAGRRGTENLFLLNGIEYPGSGFLGTTPGGVSGQLLGIDAVREFNVQANTYGAEYGKRAGGQITIVTMSGGNQFHGTVFEFLRNSALDARNFFDIRKPQFRRNNFGGAAGGPIRKDRTFIFGNYEGFRQALTTTNVSFVPDANARQGLLPTGTGGSLVNVGVAPGMAPFFALFSQPNGPTLGGGIAQAFVPAVNPVREEFGTARMDQVFSEQDWFSAAYTIDDGSSTTPQQNPLSGSILTLRSQVLSLEETHTFSPNVINTARFGFSRGAFFNTVVPLISLPANLSMVAGRPMGIVSIGGTASGNAGGAISPFGSSSAIRQDNRNLFTYSDSVQIIKGKHLINVGAWFQRVRLNDLSGTSFGFGGVTFPDLASFLQGKASLFQAGLNFEGKATRQWEGAWYVQDTIKIFPNLALNLGLRHEFTNGSNVHPAGPVNYIFGPDGAFQTQPLIGTSLFTKNNAKWLLGPRIGLAWDPTGKGKTSIHAGFGTYHNLLDDVFFQVPQSGAVQLSNIQFPIQVLPGTTLPAGGIPTPRNVSPPDAKTPTVQEWSFTVEQQIAAGTSLSIGYVGSHGYHIIANADLNPARSVICSASAGNCPAGLADGTKFFPAGSPKLNPSLGSSNSWLLVAISSYHSLQMDVRQRLTKGLTFRANYSFSKALDDGSSQTNGESLNSPAFILDVFDPLRDYGPAAYDIQHRFSFSGGYDLPIGQGKTFLSASSSVANALLGGWKVNGIVAVQTGVPLGLLNGFNSSRNGNSTFSDRPSVNPNFSGSRMIRSVRRWFDPNAFVLPPAGTYGNTGRNILRASGLSEVDLSLIKDTRLGEKRNLEFRAEFFNVLNHANFGIPSRSLFTASGAPVGSAGVITSTITTARQIQVGLKLAF